MYENLHLNGIGEFEENDKLYWTSTEHDDNTATATDFSNGDQGWQCKQCDFNFMNIRAVRYF
jgi:transposase-like protein